MLRSGFLKLLQQALRVKQNGLASLGIPCGSYIFLNCPTHKRSEANPFGNETLGYVATANLSAPEFNSGFELAINGNVLTCKLSILFWGSGWGGEWI